MNMRQDKIDVVYTWVDDTFPGYAEVLARHAGKPADTNPNRTRDNLDLLRYSLRSLRHLPELGHVHLLTCRPQVPRWLDPGAPGLTVHHHDAVMDAGLLPTFNSFCIVSHLHLLPGLSDRFLYLEDDMLLLRPGLMAAMADPDGRPLSHFTTRATVPADRLKPGDSPWNHALANADRALDAAYGPRPRHHAIHGPRIIDKARFAQVLDRFAPEVAATRAARFRANDNVPPEYLYPHAAVDEGWHRAATRAESDTVEGYVSIDNVLPLTRLMMWRMERRRPLTATFNDNFGARPNPRVVAFMRRWLQARFPDPSPYERADSTRS
ncbi:hypothetical protein [Pseudooceanicola sp. LIPI14-2-Ac024]|uniref:hypothetical protein n=1 Tax=Pseudooceanicola sp. LIPI14-2-Ac024 TaxID=3344875 RepID=UPI0035CF95EF